MVLFIGGANTRVIWKDHRATSVNQSTFTANSVPFDEPSPRRHVIVSFRCTTLGANSNNPHACTIGGVAATLVFPPPDIAVVHRQFWIALVPTGTDGTITVTRAGNMTGQVMNAWVAYDLKSAAAVDAKVSALADPSSINLAVTPGGIIVAYADATSPGAWAWTGATEDVEATHTTIGYTAASRSKVPAGPINLQADTTVNSTMIAASFR